MDMLDIGPPRKRAPDGKAYAPEPELALDAAGGGIVLGHQAVDQRQIQGIEAVRQ
jgi:hypothetical protein